MRIRLLISISKGCALTCAPYFQVVFVQSLQNSETLTVVPFDEQSNSPAMSQPVEHHCSDSANVVDSSSDVTAGLQVLSSGSSSLDSVQQELQQELTVKQVEAMLNQGWS